MLEKIKYWFKCHIDYRIVGSYYEYDGKGRYVKKYRRRYFFKK